MKVACAFAATAVRRNQSYSTTLARVALGDRLHPAPPAGPDDTGSARLSRLAEDPVAIARDRHAWRPRSQRGGGPILGGVGRPGPWPAGESGQAGRQGVIQALLIHLIHTPGGGLSGERQRNSGADAEVPGEGKTTFRLHPVRQVWEVPLQTLLKAPAGLVLPERPLISLGLLRRRGHGPCRVPTPGTDIFGRLPLSP